MYPQFESNVKSIRARFAGTCLVCRQAFAVGTTIKPVTIYSATPARQGWGHADCVDQYDADIEQELHDANLARRRGAESNKDSYNWQG